MENEQSTCCGMSVGGTSRQGPDEFYEMILERQLMVRASMGSSPSYDDQK